MNPQRLKRIRKRREEDDEEFIFLILPILRFHQMGSRGQMERMQRHSSVLYGKKRVEEILNGHVKNCRVAYRMEAHIFRSLASYLRREKLVKDKRIKVEEKLAFFLYMLSHNASFEDLQKAALGVKKPSPKIRKRRSPKELKPRAQWNLAMEKSLVEILHDHNNEYYRAQNGWSGDTWNQMTKIFQERNKHVNYTKSQLQDKEKELKREYKMLKEARMQSGAGWCEESCRIQADEDLWANLKISFPKISKFMKHPFPLFDSLGDLYDGQIAEGTYNFTSTCEPSQIGGEYEDESVAEDDDVQCLGEVGPSQRRDEASSVNQVDVGERVDNEQHAQKKAASAPKKNPPKELKKPNRRDEMVGVVDRYVKMKEKQAEDEKAESNVFSIAKCISALHKMKEFSREERVKASKVFKVAENREMFLTWAAEDEESAIMWLRGELQDLP